MDSALNTGKPHFALRSNTPGWLDAIELTLPSAAEFRSAKDAEKFPGTAHPESIGVIADHMENRVD
jgi:hypothetical protein